jgi:hypothetical protein
MVESALRESENLNGLSQEKTQGENCQAQAAQAHEGAPA